MPVSRTFFPQRRMTCSCAAQTSGSIPAERVSKVIIGTTFGCTGNFGGMIVPVYARSPMRRSGNSGESASAMRLTNV